MRTWIATLLAAVAWAGVAHASGGGHEAAESGPPYDKIALHAFNLLVLLGVLAWYLRGTLRDALKNRALGIKRAIDEANAMRKDARERFDELERKLDGFEAELAAMRKDAERAAAAERETILARARADAEHVERTAEQAIRDETARARAALRRDAARLSIELARKRLVAQVGEGDDRRLAQDFLTAVRGGEVADG